MPGLTPYTRAPQELPKTQDLTPEINRASENIHRNRLEQEQRQERADNEYLQAAKVDNVYTDNVSLQDLQTKNINGFLNNLRDTYHKYRNNGYQLPLEERVKIQQQKQALIGWQLQMQQGQKQLTDINKEAEKDVGGKKIDKDYVNFINREWHAGYQLNEETGQPVLDEKGNKIPFTQIPDNAIREPRVKDIPGFIKEQNLADGVEITERKLIGGKWVDVKSTKNYIDKDANGNIIYHDDVAKDVSKRLFMVSEPYRDALVKDFDKGSPEERQKWYDKYPNQKVQAVDMMADYAWTKYKNAFFDERKKSYTDEHPKTTHGKKEYIANTDESSNPSGQAYIQDTDVPEPASSKNGKVKINNEEDAKKIIAKTHKTNDDTEALSNWGHNKTSAKKSSPVDYFSPIDKIKNSLVIKVPAGVDIDVDTGKENIRPSGESQFTNMVIDYRPWNAREHRWAKGKEYGSYNNLNPGWEIKPFLIAKDKDSGKDTRAKLLTESDLKAIEDAPESNFKRGNFKWSLGKQSKEEKNANDDFEQYKRK